MKNRLLLVSSLATALSAMTAGAIPVNITAGGLAPVSPNNSLDSNVNFLKQQISLWNPDPNLSIGSQGVALNVENLTGTTYNFLPGYQYVVLKAGPNWQAYYLGGSGGLVSSPTGQGFSSARYVPDGGSTAMLLGAALSVIALARRKLGV
jgi:hypothetical protein